MKSAATSIGEGRVRFGQMRLNCLVLDRSGSVAVEFAIISLVLLMLIVEGMQAGLYLYTSASLERATAKAARQVLTGAVSGAGLTAAQFRSQTLCPQLPAAMNCANVITTFQSVPEAVAPKGFFSFVNTAGTGLIPPSQMDNSQTSFCAGSGGQVIFAQVFYAMPVFSPAWQALAGVKNGRYFVGTTAAFQNEPFQGGSQC